MRNKVEDILLHSGRPSRALDIYLYAFYLQVKKKLKHTTLTKLGYEAGAINVNCRLKATNWLFSNGYIKKTEDGLEVI